MEKYVMSLEEREFVKIQTQELRENVQVEKNKLFHFRNFFVASIILIVFFSNKSFDSLFQLDIFSIIIEIILITFSFLMFLCKWTALDNLIFAKRMLWMYEAPEDEVIKQFIKFCNFNYLPEVPSPEATENLPVDTH